MASATPETETRASEEVVGEKDMFYPLIEEAEGAWRKLIIRVVESKRLETDFSLTNEEFDVALETLRRKLEAVRNA